MVGQIAGRAWSWAALVLVLAGPVFGQSSAGTGTAGASAGSGPAETKEQKDTRMAWWREARFGMFIHWGIYSVPAGVYQGKEISRAGEWIMNGGSIPVGEYAKFAGQFNPTKFNADEFVSIARNAGMKYIVITSKHHDGFALFKSADPFNIVDATPFKRDVIKEMSEAARKQGIHFGVYYSQAQDWSHAGGYALGRAGRANGAHWDPAQEGSFDEYLNKVAIAQVKELLGNYHPEILWWDTSGPTTLEQATKLHDLLKLAPGIITNNRLMNTRLPGALVGDTETPEGTIPATGFPGGRDWETCMTINGSWGYKSSDTNWKSTETLLRNLIDIASKGGNYLLNVGPTAEGIIPQPETERLSEMGKWLAVNGEAIYGTGPNPFPAVVATGLATGTGPATTRSTRAPVVWDWRATTKPGKIYLHIFQWPADGQFKVPALPAGASITKAYLLSDPARTPLGITAFNSGLPSLGQSIKLPPTAPDRIASVVVLETK